MSGTGLRNALKTRHVQGNNASPASVPQSLEEFIAAGRKITESLPEEPGALYGELTQRLRDDVGTGLEATVSSKGAGAVLVRAASAQYPRAWVEAANAFGPLYARLTGANGRGWHTSISDPALIGKTTRLSDFGVVTIRKNAGYLAVRWEDIPNAIHEYAHRLQSALPGLQAKFMEMHRRRTRGEALQSLKVLEPKSRYRHDEMTRKDHYIEAYWGKEYDGTPLEVMTMAMQTMLSGRRWEKGRLFRKLYTEDREMFDFIVGLLFHWRP